MNNEFKVVETPLAGHHLIEASAGTGKTYSLIHIVLRLIVEERIPVDRLLLVTFTKAATAELKMRVRELLVRAHEAYIGDQNSSSLQDSTLAALIDKWHKKGIKAEVFRQAIDRMDDASICTIHSFCQKMLEEHKFSSSEGFDFQIDEDSDLKDEVIEEFLRKELNATKNNAVKQILISYSPWHEILNAIASVPEGTEFELFDHPVFVDPKTGDPLEEKSEQTDLEAEIRLIMQRFIDSAPKDLKRKKREAGVRSFDDLLLDMYKELENISFVRRVQKRYDGVLIDEFQDTDPIQYAIFKRLFLANDSCSKSIFFVGDPKQSIYRFRNADLNTYLAAKNDIGSVFELRTNYRSNPVLLKAFNSFYTCSSQPFLDSGISYSPIEAGANKKPLYIHCDGQSHPLPVFEIWCKKDDTQLNPSCSRDQQAELIASEIQALLSGCVYKADGKKLLPGDIAVLVRRKADAETLIGYLNRRGIRVLFQDENNVFNTEEAQEILRLLQALESPNDVRLLKLARSTRLMGESINSIVPEAFDSSDNIAGADKAALKARELIEEAQNIANKRGISAGLTRIMLECDTQQRLLPLQNGERRLTNYQQLIEILQQASLSLKGISGLARWLSQQIAHPIEDESYHLRIDSDADLVNIMTIHKSKGLEFPVVFLLYGNELDTFSGHYFKKCVFKEVVRGEIHLKISFTPLYPDVVQSIAHEEKLEILRLAYVAMTRASQRLVLPLNYFTSSKKLVGFDNGYSRSLTGEASVSADQYKVVLNKLKKEASDSIHIRILDDEMRSVEWHHSCQEESVTPASNEKLSAAPGRIIATSWFPTSYTAIARGAAETTEMLTLIEEKEDLSDDEINRDNDFTDSSLSSQAELLSIMNFERGLESGTFLHSLFERTNYLIVKKTIDGIAEAEKTLNSTLKRHLLPFKYHLEPFGVDDWLPVFNKLLKDVLGATIFDKTVFGTQNSLRLCDLDPSRKTAEMNFTIAIGDPSEGRLPVTAKNLSRLLTHFDPLYHINIENDRELKGYLTGAIDLVFEFEEKFFVLDWKGTKLAEQAEDFTTDRMMEEIRRHHYSLQYLIYLVALRRHLRFCGVKNPDENIAGAIYAFIRGIRADDEKPFGVFIARPPRALIECLDEFFECGYHEGAVRAYAAQCKNEKDSLQ